MVYLLPLVIISLTADPSTPVAHDPIVTTTPPPPATALLRAESRRVRAMDPRAERLLAEGMRRSRTFASLMSSVQKTDVIVYVEVTRQLPARIGGRLLFQALTQHERYLRVQILESLRPHQAIEVLAHELRHVLEVADEPSVVDEAGLAALYRRIGYPSVGHGGYDTNAARLTSHVVRRELGG
jgi:hypothetical protein